MSRATLDGWVLRVAELLIPVSSAMRKELLSGGYIQADETPVPVQTQDGREKHHQATYGNTVALEEPWFLTSL